MVRHYFLTLYDHLGQAVLLNLIWVISAFPWIALGSVVSWTAAAAGDVLGHSFLAGVGFVAAAGLILLSPPTLFLFVTAHHWVHEGQGGIRGAWVMTRRLAWRAQAGGVLTTLVVTLLLGNALFYQTWTGWLGLALSGVMIWITLGVMLTGMLLFPVLVDNPDLTLLGAIRYCVLLVLDNLRRCVLIALATTLCLLAGAVSGVGLALGALPATALVVTLGLTAMLQRYGGRAVVRDSRGLRDLLRPWQA